MNTTMKTFVRFAFVCIAVCAVTGSAEAARWRTCNGSAVKWRGTLNIHRNRCSIADTGLVNSAYWNGMRQWNRLSNVVDGTFANPASDCFISFGDGQNEVGLTNRANINGANGLTVLQLGLCFIGSNDIDEADVMIANDLSFTAHNGNFLGTTGRSTFVHEFGHLFGFLHENAHDVMRTSPPHLLTGGAEPSTVWPSDTIGMTTDQRARVTRPVSVSHSPRRASRSSRAVVYRSPMRFSTRSWTWFWWSVCCMTMGPSAWCGVKSVGSVAVGYLTCVSPPSISRACGMPRGPWGR